MTDPAAWTYHQALREITDRGRYGVRLGLGRTRALLAALGNPERELRGALVGGTNGKGSVLALVGSVLRAAGLRVGETPKPHLVTYRERMQIDGRPIAPEAFAALAAEVAPVAKRIAPRHGEPTEFELLTAMIFRWFAGQRLDLALVEVGLGGRLDATNVWDGGVAAITNVELDHMDRLGPTIPLIAREKAAIIKRGDLAVTAATGDGLAVIRRRARRLDVPLAEVRPAPLLGWDRDGIDVELPSVGSARIGLRGRHQAANAAVADAILDALEAAGIARADPPARRRGYAAARWPGRLELVRAGGRDVLLDGAHNPSGATALGQALVDLRPFLGAPGEPLTLVMATMADKDVDGSIAALVGSGAFRRARVVCTTVESGRALPAAELAARWRTAGSEARTEVVPEPRAALERALESGDGPVVVAGSLYLVGALRPVLVDDRLLADPPDSGAAA